MTIRDYIIQEYNAVKENFNTFSYDLTNENQLNEIRTCNYVKVVVHISSLASSFIHLEHKSRTELIFKIVLWILIENCVTEGIKPKIKDVVDYGFEEFEIYSNEQRILQYLEGYMKCQNTKFEPMWWIQLGIKLNILNLEK